MPKTGCVGTGCQRVNVTYYCGNTVTNEYMSVRWPTLEWVEGNRDEVTRRIWQSTKLPSNHPVSVQLWGMNGPDIWSLRKDSNSVLDFIRLEAF